MREAKTEKLIEILRKDLLMSVIETERLIAVEAEQAEVKAGRAAE